MNEKYGNVLGVAGSNNIVLITTNAQPIYGKKKIVAGGGIAKAVQEHHEDFASDAYEAINKVVPLGEGSVFNDYHLLFLTHPYIGVFQTKRLVKDRSDILLIIKGLKILHYVAKSHPYVSYHLPRPGCGLGGLSWNNQVKKWCQEYLDLPNVYVWHNPQ